MLGSALGFALGRRDDSYTEVHDSARRDYERQQLQDQSPEPSGEGFSANEGFSTPVTNKEDFAATADDSIEPVAATTPAKEVSLKIDGEGDL